MNITFTVLDYYYVQLGVLVLYGLHLTSNVHDIVQKIVIYAFAESDSYATKTHFLRSQVSAIDTKYLEVFNKRVIALIPMNIVLRWDIYGCSQPSVLRYPNSGQYSPISVQ